MPSVRQRLSSSTRLRKLGQRLTGIDWQLALAKLLIVVLVLIGFYIKGRGDGKASCEKQYATQALEQAKRAKAFAPVVDKQATAAAQQDQRLTTKQDKYNEQVDKTPRATDCDLSPDELRAFQDLVEG